MKEKVRSIIFASLIISISIVNGISPTKVFSSKENRYLEGFPKLDYNSITSGKFSSEFENYATDQFIARDNWIWLKTLSQLAIFKKDNGRVYFGKEDYLFDIPNDIDEEQFEENMNNINKFLEELIKYNNEIVIKAMLVPTKTEILGGKLPPYAPIIDEKMLMERIKSKLSNNITVIDLIDTLKAYSNVYIYYKTDHHWTTHGAYYAYKSYMDAIGQTPLTKDQFIMEEVADDFLGTSYRKANLYLGQPDSIYNYRPLKAIDYKMTINNETEEKELYDESFLNKTDKYSYFLGGDKALINIETSVKNNKTIVVVKDSFANSLLPFLINHYENIVVLDTRYYNSSIGEYIKGIDADEVLLLYNIQNFVNEKSFLNFGI